MNQAGIDLLTSFEGCRLESYQDEAGIWTVGYGHTRGACPQQVITPAQAEAFLLQDCGQVEQVIHHLVKVPLTDNELSALVCFAYNVGTGSLGRSTLLQKLNAGDKSGAAEEFLKWDKIAGKDSPGLARRRLAERALFLTIA